MGLNVKEIQHRFCRTVQDSTKSSYTFVRKHPLVSGALLVLLILYMFLSYIYSFLVYLSPFLACTAIFVRIFWSSEQTQFKYVKREDGKGELEQKKVEPRIPRIPHNSNRRRELLYKYPSQNATSRRRNFRGRKWDVYGGLEEKAKNLSAVFHNEFTTRNAKGKEVTKSSDNWEDSLDHDSSQQAPIKRQSLRSEPSMRDLVEACDNEFRDAGRGKTEDGGDDEDDDDEETQNKAIEWTEDDQRNLMDLGISELERNRRLESLIARRKEKKLLRVKVENGQIDHNMKTGIPRHIAPVVISRGDPFDSPRGFEGFDGLEVPGSAPSVMPRSPYDIPYDVSEEKPDLTGDSFLQEITNQRHESFGGIASHFPLDSKQEHGARDPNPFYNTGRKYSERPAYPRFRKLPDKGSHDWLIDQLIYNEAGGSGLQAPNSQQKGEPTTPEEDGKCEDMKDENAKNAHETISTPNHTSEPSLIPSIRNVETTRVSEKPRPRVTISNEMLNFPIPTATPTPTSVNEYDSFPSPISKRHENMWRNCHTPTYSIASDLQVEVSEVGSLASTVDETGETNSNTDRDSVLYDGDIDRDVSSGSEDLWGASFHGRPTHRAGEEDVAEANNNSKDMASFPNVLRQIDEEIVADVSSISSSKSDEHENTPTHAMNSDHNNIFGYMNEAPQSSNSSHVSSPPEQLTNCSVDLPNEANSEISEEWCNLSENVINNANAQVINDLSNSATIEQVNMENSRSNEHPSTSFARQESIDDISIYSIASSPRSVLPEKTLAEDLAQQPNMEDMARETLNDDHPPDTIPQNNQPLMDDTNDESHNVDLDHLQEQTNPLENSMEEPNISGEMNDAEVNNKQEEEMSKNDKNSEDNSLRLIREGAFAESTNLVGETTLEDMNEKPRELVEKEVPSIVEDDNKDKSADGNSHEDFPQASIIEPTIPSRKENEGPQEDS